MEHTLDISNAAQRSPAHTRGPAPSAADSSQHPVLSLQQQAGNQATRALLYNAGLRTSLAISQPDEPEELEAEATADSVMRAQDPSVAGGGCSCTGDDDDMCEECMQARGKRTAPSTAHTSVHRSASGSTPINTLPPSIQQAIRSPGQPLDLASRSFFEPRFDHDFSSVRIHTEGAAAASATSIQAHAYTLGSDIVFAPGRHSPATTAGRTLIAHELTHVVQQESGDTKVRRDPQPDPLQDAPTPFDAELRVDNEIEQINLSDPWEHNSFRMLLMLEAAKADWPDEAAFDSFLQDRVDDSLSAGDTKDDLKNAESAFHSGAVEGAMEDFDRKAAAPSLRLMVLLQAKKDQWTDREGFPELLDRCIAIADSEESTAKAFSLSDLSDRLLSRGQEKAILESQQPHINYPDAFPETWSGYLAKYLTMGEASNYPHMLEEDAAAELATLTKTGNSIPGDILGHGLPLAFPISLDVQGFELYSTLGAGFSWLASPSGELFGNGRSLNAFSTQGLKYLRVVSQADFTNLWNEYAQSVIQQVKDGELWVDPPSFVEYKHSRPGGVSLQEAVGLVSGFPSPPTGRIDPRVAEAYVTNLAGLVAFGKSFEHSRTVRDVATGLLRDADLLIANESKNERLIRAEDWAHEQGFYSDALDQEWADIKEHAGEIAKDMGKDIALFTALQFVPVVNVIADIYAAASLIFDIGSTLGDVYAVDQEARDATTAVALQRAAAHRAAVLSSAARKIATAVAAHKASKLASKAAQTGVAKAGDWISKGSAATTGTSTPPSPPLDPWDTTRPPAPKPGPNTTPPAAAGAPTADVPPGGGKPDAAGPTPPTRPKRWVAAVGPDGKPVMTPAGPPHMTPNFVPDPDYVPDPEPGQEGQAGPRDIEDLKGPHRLRTSPSNEASLAAAAATRIPRHIYGDGTVMTRADFPDVLPDQAPGIGRPAPQALDLGRAVGGSDVQNAEVQQDIEMLRDAGGSDFRVNQRQTVGTQQAGTNRPDLSCRLNGRRVHIEYDRFPMSRAIDHARRILTNDPDAIVILKGMDYDTGRRR
jgi:hypothetical protein